MESAMMDRRDTLTHLGQLRYGAQWQTDLAERIGTSVRTVQRWAGGKSIPPGALTDVKRALVHDALKMLEEAEMTYYVVSVTYIGPNQQQHLDDDCVEIRTEPPRNTEGQVREHGWLGSHNDVSEHGLGSFASLDEAEAECKRRLADKGYRRKLPDDLDDDERVAVRYRVGTLPPMSAEQSEAFAYESAQARITAETTDDEITAWVDECRADAEREAGEALDTDVVRRLAEERRDELAGDAAS